MHQLPLTEDGTAGHLNIVILLKGEVVHEIMRYITFAMFFLLFLPVATAMSIENQSIEVVVGEKTAKNFTVFNDKNHNCYNLEFISDDDIDIAEIDYIKNNTFKNHTFLVTTATAYDLYKQVNAKYLRKEFVPGEQLNYTIEIEGDFTPNQIEMTDNDYVVFYNVDSVNHTIKELNGSFEYEIAPAQKLQLGINKNTTVYDKDTNQSAKIVIVPEEEQYVHYSDDDINFSIHIISKHKETGLTITLLEERIEAEYNETIHSTMLVETGNQSAYNISLEGAEFEKNHFNLSANRVEVVDFSIDLDFYREDQTNKSYFIDISAYADNSEKVEVQLEIYVKGAEIDEERDMEEFCAKDYEDLSQGDRLFWRVVCEGEQLVRTETVTKYEETIIDPFIEVKASTLEEALAMAKDNQEALSGVEKTVNQRMPDYGEKMEQIKGQFQDLLLAFEDLKKDKNQTEMEKARLMQTIDQFEKEKHSKRVWSIFWGILLAFGLLLGGGFMTIYRVKQDAEVEL